ncbi:hypothetical protein L682_13580 [Aquipseudomonas alcaligenes OT 69]|nr:hypothetical protein L682_13580 [Pseudomonas alcaligenes OT 69]
MVTPLGTFRLRKSKMPSFPEVPLLELMESTAPAGQLLRLVMILAEQDMSLRT